MMSRILITISLLIMFPFCAFAERVYLFQWDEGLGTTMPGWTWSETVYGDHPGWIMDEDGPFGGSITYPWGDSVRTLEKSDYGNDTRTRIVTDDRAPSTSTGGALETYDTGVSSTYQACYWVWYDGQSLQNRGVTDSDTDRWSFYLKTTGTTAATSSDFGSIFHVGTYLTDDTACGSYTTGEGAPYEGPGNQHYYHYLYLSPDAWIHVELDRHPTYKRGSYVAGDDPAFILPADDTCDPVVSHPMHYYGHMHQWYMEIARAQAQETSYFLDEMFLYSTQDPTESAESNQNNDSITSPWVGYWPSTGKWEMGWHDMSFTDENGWNTNDSTMSTFEIRWSVFPITNTNYLSATVVEPAWFSGSTVTSFPNGVRRADAWQPRLWTQFELPDETESANDIIYFAVKDVSSITDNAGTNWPYNINDGHNAPTSNIRTIDYAIRTEGVGPTRSGRQPSGEQTSGTTQVTMSLTTDVSATCKYGAEGATGVDYDTLANTLDGTGTTSHTVTISGLTDGNSYSRAVRCQKTSDSEQNDTDYVISWSVASGTPVTTRQAFSGSGSFLLLQ